MVASAKGVSATSSVASAKGAQVDPATYVAELYDEHNGYVGSREYDSERRLRMDAQQHGWTRFATEGRTWRLVVRPGDERRFAGVAKVAE